MDDTVFNAKSFQMHQLFKSDGFSSFCQLVYPSILRSTAKPLQKYPELAEIILNPMAVSRDFLPGHLTTSTVILDPNRTECLLLLHRKIGEWVYPGGHADGDWHLLRSALRECFEETALDSVKVLMPREGRGELKDALCPHHLQRFLIRPYGEVSGHIHYDCVFVLEALSKSVRHNPEESSEIRWFPRSLLETVAVGADGDCIDGLDPLTARICLNSMQSARD